MTIRATEPADRDAVEAITRSVGLFEPEQVAEVLAMFDEHHASPAPTGRWWVLEQDRELVGVAYAEPERMTDRVWNLLYIAVRADQQGRGFGTELLRGVRRDLASNRRWMVETAAIEEFAPVRRWYEREGFVRVAELPDYYADGVGKTVLMQPLSGREGQA
ncbi:MAG: GNAT family N-acetyltransferase [Planctomycetota bacterium]